MTRLTVVTMHLFQARIRISEVQQGRYGNSIFLVPGEAREQLSGLELFSGPIEPSDVVSHRDTFFNRVGPMSFSIRRVRWQHLFSVLKANDLGHLQEYFTRGHLDFRPHRIDSGYSWFRSDEVEVIDDEPELWISRAPGATIHRQMWTEENGHKHPLVLPVCRRCELGYPAILADSASNYNLFRYMPAGYAQYPGSICLTRTAVDELLVKGDERVCKVCLNHS